jgi:threonine/homoserine/homoserine lactone efflux protein
MLVFLLAALVLVLIPGPGVLYIVARSLDQGREAGLVSVVGVATGNMVQVLVAAAGLSALIASSATAYEVLRVAGAAYLIWLGVARLLGADILPDAQAPAVAHHRIYAQGVIVAMLNPKTALFFVAFLPQFVNAASATFTLQVLVLGALFVTLAMCTDSVYALASGSIGLRLRGRNGVTVARASRIGAGLVYVLLGLFALLGVRRT